MDTTSGQIRKALSWLAIVWERLARALWPVAALIAVFCGLAFFDVVTHIPVWLHSIGLLCLAAAVITFLWRGVQRFRLPSGIASIRRLQRINGLRHRPLEGMLDRLAEGTGDAESQAIWRLHRKRMRAEVKNLRVGAPRPALIRFDRFAFRVAAGVLFIVGLAAAGTDATPRLKRAMVPQLAFLQPPPPPVIDAWITPPAYTEMAPVYLTGTEAKPNAFVEVPTASQLSVRISGAFDTPLLRRTRGEVAPPRLDEKSHGTDITLGESESIAVTVGDTQVAEWSIRTTPDAIPRAAFLSTPSEGRGNVLRIDFRANDDYGLTGVRAVVSRPNRTSTSGKNAPKVLDLPLPKVGAKKVVSVSYHDLTSHPWSGLPVEVHLEATDAAGQIGQNEPVRIILPEREFNHPVAREIVIERRKLSADSRDARLVGETLGDIAWQPERYADDTTVFLSLRTAARRLFDNPTEETIEAVQQLLWDTALRVEDGKLSLARRSLRDAEDALREALEKDTTDRELSKLMDQLEDALNNYFDELAKMMKDVDRKKLQAMPRNDKAIALTRRDFKKLMDQIRKLANSGSRVDAKRMLSQLKNLLENMRTGQMAQMSPRGQKSMKLLNQLQSLIKEQQQLLDQTFRDAKERGQLNPRPGEPRFRRPGDRRFGEMRPGDPRRGQMRPGNPRPGQMQPGATKPGEAGQGAQVQEALRRRLGELMRQLGEMTNSIPRPMGRAERSMRRSTDFLEGNRPGEAIAPQTRALDQLQESAKKATQQLMRQMGQGLGRRPNQLGERRDPFGRTPDGGTGLNTSDIGIKEPDALQRAREIRNELRRRAGQQSRPEPERDYINRLLQEF